MSGPNERDRKMFADWTKSMGLPHEIPLPADQRELQIIFLRLAQLEDKAVRACVLFNATAKQDIEFDEGGEDYEVDQQSSGRCAC